MILTNYSGSLGEFTMGFQGTSMSRRAKSDYLLQEAALSLFEENQRDDKRVDKEHLRKG